jgi:hypothetical protein
MRPTPMDPFVLPAVAMQTVTVTVTHIVTERRPNA